MSRVVFVGNVPYNMGEDQLIEVFKAVGHVVGFRLVYDRETNKPRGYGFCEFSDHETAQSAVRNLNGTDVGGRPLRIDLADSDPFLEGRTTTRGELLEDYARQAAGPPKPDILNSLPPGVPVPPGKSSLDVITQALTNIRTSQVLDVLAQMKTYVTNYPQQARDLLSHNPQLAFALFQALILNDVVDRSVIERMQSAAAAKVVTQPPPPPMQPHMPQVPHIPQQPIAPYGHYGQLPPTMNMQSMVPQVQPQPYIPAAPAQVISPPPSTMPQTNMWNRPPPPPQQVPAPTPSTPDAQNADQQRAMLMQVLQLTPEQINQLPAGEKAVVEQLRSQLFNSLRPGS